MNLYRFFFAGGSSITFTCHPQQALPLAASFAKWLDRELLRIKELRPLATQLELV